MVHLLSNVQFIDLVLCLACTRCDVNFKDKSVTFTPPQKQQILRFFLSKSMKITIRLSYTKHFGLVLIAKHKYGKFNSDIP